MAAIRAEHETQNRTIQTQKSALDGIISDLSSLRFLGKEPEAASVPQSPRTSPAPEGTPLLDADSVIPESTSAALDETDDEKMISEPGSQKASSEGLVSEGATEENDIEMGEVEEDPREKSKKKLREEELEEGEATDASSELSEPPDD